MNGKRILIVTGIVAALGVPAGVAVAATADAGVANRGPASTAPGGVGYGRMMNGGYGDPDDCPLHNSTEAQQWRDQRADRQKLSATERQKLAEQHRATMRGSATSTATS